MTDVADIERFVERVREERSSAGRIELLADESLYRILDGLLASKREEVSRDAEAA